MSSPPVAYYITAHGYGHGVRSCDILRAFNQQHPDVPVIITSDLSSEFLKSRLPSGMNSFRRGAFDVGMVQIDSIRVDLPATLELLRKLYARRDRLVEQERAFLKQCNAGVVIVDIPGMPLRAAAFENIPGLAVGNFGWDWIYAEYASLDRSWQELSDLISDDYGKADLLLKMPFSEPMKAFTRQQEIPLVASPGRPRREEMTKKFQISAEKKWVLLSFTSLDWEPEALDRVSALEDYEFFTVRPLAWERRNIHPVDRQDIPFADVIASVDIVVTKPGFGIVSECVVNRKPIVYTERADFREYAVMVETMRKCLRLQHLPGEQLYQGDLRAALEAIELCAVPPQQLSAGGDVIAADWIWRLLQERGIR